MYIYLSKPKTNKITFSTSFKNSILQRNTNVTSLDAVEFSSTLHYEGNDKHKYDVSIYWDFEQTEFYVNDKEFKTYPININNNEYDEIFNFKLDKNFKDGMHTLLIVIQDRDFNSKKLTELVASYNFIVGNSSITESSSNKISSYIKSPFKIYTDEINYLNVVNNDFADSSQKYQHLRDYNKEKVLEVTPNTEIELAFRFKNFVNIGKQLTLFELNNNQINIDNKPFLIYDLDSNIGFVYDKIKLTTPSEKGEYRLKSSIISNPYSENFSQIYSPDFTYKLIVK
ncbi:hypothetical protein [Clostridium intestinale]|uniref:hypothetical protein n=1 Tax=Clostridium intestinale TaxID=36845 RepID=UPI0028EC256C|nr:hypothetical protein [Clostridium intestinale]